MVFSFLCCAKLSHPPTPEKPIVEAFFSSLKRPPQSSKSNNDMLASTTMDITIHKAERTKLNDLNLENIPFGKYFTDHMLEADYENGEWKNVEIKPYQPLLLSPSMAALHYGQAIFEGIKAYKDEEGKPLSSVRRTISAVSTFLPSACRCPQVPEDIFMEGMKQLVALDSSWIPQ
jgi:branched-chain amino acid aminotransferase